MNNVFNENGARDIWFTLKEDFVSQFKRRQPKWGPVGYVTYKRTYSRQSSNGKSEEYWQTVRRVVEGVFTIQKRHCHINNLPWKESKAQKSAQKMYQLMWDFKFTPPGRGLWMMGTDAVYDKGISALVNCSFISTENIDIDFAEPFTFMMDMSMLGVGVGSDVKGAGKITIKKPKEYDETFVVPDTREGWVELLRMLLNAFVGKNPLPKNIDYSEVRPFGTPIKGFGGTASGPGPLIELYDNIYNLLMTRIGEKITETDIVDIHNYIGRCVVSGNIRRSAQIIFGNPDSDEFLNLKNPELYKEELMDRRWASNNSVFATVGMDYSKVAELTAKNGEPGYVWLDNAKNYGRMNGIKNTEDSRINGFNPCGEIVLENSEMCNLSESYPSNHDSLEDWINTLKYAYMYSKTVTLLPSHNKYSNAVMMKNRRIGLSVTGIVQAFKKFGRREVLNAFDKGYNRVREWDKTYSDWLCIPRSIKISTAKPSGCQIPQTKIKTSEGIKTLEQIFMENGVLLSDKVFEIGTWYDVKKAIFVIDENDNSSKITKLFINGFEPTIEMIIDDGTTIECTENHRFKMKDGSWKQAKNIKENDEFM